MKNEEQPVYPMNKGNGTGFFQNSDYTDELIAKEAIHLADEVLKQLES